MKYLKSLVLALVAGVVLLSVSFAGDAEDAKKSSDCESCDHCCAGAGKTDKDAKAGKADTGAKADDEKKC